MDFCKSNIITAVYSNWNGSLLSSTPSHLLFCRFRDEAVDGDLLSSDAQGSESSEASGSESSDGSGWSPRKKYAPKRRSLPALDPATGMKRKPGRPRKIENMPRDGAGSAVQKRKLGRPRKAGNGPRNDAATSPKNGVVKRKPGRPRKVVDTPTVGNGAGGGGGGGGGSKEKRKPGRPSKKPTTAVPNVKRSAPQNGVENGTEPQKKRKGRGRPPKKVVVLDAGDGAEGTVVKTPAAASPPPKKRRATDKTVVSPPSSPARGLGRERHPAGGSAAGAGVPRVAGGSSGFTRSPINGLKRGRGRPPKSAGASSVAGASASSAAVAAGDTAVPDATGGAVAGAGRRGSGGGDRTHSVAAEAKDDRSFVGGVNEGGASDGPGLSGLHEDGNKAAVKRGRGRVANHSS